MNPEKAGILVVEDNRGDAYLLREAFLENDLCSHLSFTKDGNEALAFLCHEGSFSQCQRPDLIVLDLKMPGMDGFTFLKKIRSCPSLSSIPVVILTGSDADSDKELAISLGARSFFIKPCKTEDWKRLASKLEAFASLKDNY